MIEFIASIAGVLAVVGFGLYAFGRRDRQVESKELAERLVMLKQERDSQMEEFKQELKKTYAEKESILREELETKNQLVLEKLRLECLAEVKEEERHTRRRLLELQEKIEEKERNLQTKADKLEQDKTQLEDLRSELRNIKTDLLDRKQTLADLERKQKAEFQSKMEQLAGLTKDQARDVILQKARQEMGSELLVWQQKILESTEEEATSKAREIVALAVQRCSSEVANEFTLTTIKLKNDDEKGKIIGKSGRNIQWLEKTLGVELLIDDTPEVITISGFSSVRRHVAKRTIEMLLEDGRVHPSSIEGFYEKAKAEIAQEIAEAGQWAVNELGIYDFPAKLVRILGRLRFRTSYGQNMLKHSVEMAKLAALLAQEMNQKFPHRKDPIDLDICIRGALLHDIGKAVDEETQPRMSHIELGEKICDTFGLDWRIRKCISSHHDESYYTEDGRFCIEAALVDACDNISGGRLGARKETAEAYFQRMEALEKVAETTPGVNKAWIMRGSRELWIFFDTLKISPLEMHQATREVAKRIQTDVRYPGEIKVVGIWEDKLVQYAS